MKINSTSVLSNIFWRFGERMGAQIVTFVVSLILARLLEPSVYGTVAILLVFITLADTLVTSGFGNALIQKLDADDIDFSSVFYFNIIFSLLLYFVIFFFAPTIENFYGGEYPLLSEALRILAIRIPISAVNNVQQAYVSRKLLFKRFFVATLWGTVGAAIIGITLAIAGAGIWALVAQYLFNTIIDTVVLWFQVKWRPIKAFSLNRLKSLMSYGWKILASGLLDSFYSNIRSLFIGKLYSSEDLAYYNKGKQFSSIVVDNINTSFMSVIFPVISLMQNDHEHIKKLLRKSVQLSSYIFMPLLIGLAAIAEPLVKLLLTDKWLETALYIKIFCVVNLFLPISKPNLQVIKGLGHSDMYLKLEIAKKIYGIILLIFSLDKGVVGIAWVFAITSIINCSLDMIIGGHLVNYKPKEQLFDISFPTISSICIYVILWMISKIQLNYIVVMLIQIVVAVIVYLFLSVITKNKTFLYLINMIKEFLNTHLRKAIQSK